MDYEEIRKYYKDKLSMFGPTAEGMDWKNKSTQYLRFERIVNFIQFESKPSILDVGCGSSELFAFCLSKNFDCMYQGLDIVKEMVDFSNEKFGKKVAVLGDIDSISKFYNYVVASGTFNAKLNSSDEEWKLFFYSNLIKMFERCTDGIIFNCMTEHVDWKYDRLFYPSLSDITKFINQNISKNFIIDHSYDLFEMTIFIKK